MPICALALTVVLQLALSRLQPSRLPWWSLAVAALAGTAFAMLATCWLGWHVPAADLVGYTLVNGGTAAALAFGYFNFVNLNFTSLRVRLLREMLESSGTTSMQSLRQRYGAETILALRLERMVRAGELVQTGSRFRIGENRRVLLIGRILGAIRVVMLGNRPSVARGRS
jgi:hypothetical protein